MRYKLFGRSGLRVSELCLGTMNFGQSGWGADAEASRRIFDTFAEAQGNFIDTAHVYGNGASETILSDLIAADRHHFVVASKYAGTAGTDIMKSGNSRKTMMQMVEESLVRLGTDYLDLFYIHFWDFTTPIDEVMRGLEDLVRMGKVRYVAASDMPAWQVSRANMLADLRGWAPFIGIQAEYSLLERTSERDLLPMARELDLGITAWSPLGGGRLMGTGGRRSAMQKRSEQVERISDAVKEVADSLGRTPAEVALAALRRQSRFGAVIPIVGASSEKQMRESLNCIDLVLDDAHWEHLDGLSRPSLGFPHTFLNSPAMRNVGTGGNFDRLDNHRAAPE
jgi:aryl-alcohol dehydrogenase-like predicted oxidoreductase